MDEPVVVLVGGFLGAGKTTLMGAVAETLSRRGKRVGLVTNDQAANLVDTALLGEHAMAVEEVSGGCFCCRFDDLMGALDRLVAAGKPDVLLGEPVGSCTDLSATVMQPIKALHRDRYRLAPASVLVDPDRVRPILGLEAGRIAPRVFAENVEYIYRKQLEEADFIVLNKIDLLTADEQSRIVEALRGQFPGPRVLSLSATQGTGVDDWLEAVLGEGKSGRTIAEVDYDVYADGEAALGWLNAAYRLEDAPGTDWKRLAALLMARLRAAFREAFSEVAHLKLHVRTDSGSLVANLTTSSGEPTVRGDIGGSPASARMLLNVRAHIEPEALRQIVERTVVEICHAPTRLSTEKLECFAPSRPEPTHRYAAVV